MTFLIGDPPPEPEEGEEAPQDTREQRVVPFTALANDVAAHGRELFERASDGDFGAVAAY